MSRCFSMVANDQYLIGLMALIHSVRRFYPDTPIYTCLKLSEKGFELFNQFKKFYGNIIVTDPSKMPLFENGHMWTYKFQAMLECKEDIVFMLDVDQLMMFYMDDWFQVAEHGFVRTGFGNFTIKDAISEFKKTYPQYADKPGLTSGSICLDKRVHSKFLDRVIENYANPDIRKYVYGDMGAFLMTLCEADYFKHLHHEGSSDLVGTIWSDAQSTEYLRDKKLFIRKYDRSRGIISLVHYNGDKPWQAYSAKTWKDNVGLRLENLDSLMLWCDIWDEVKEKTGITVDSV
jgi:hypothetical protein